MGSNTTRGYPYPVGTDRVMDGDNAIQALAEKVDTQLGSIKVGTTSPTTDSGARFVLTHGLGRIPLFVVVVVNNSALVAAPEMPSATATTVNVVVRNLSNGAPAASAAVGAVYFFAWG